ncbi:MAG: glycoside hydrolase family 130 protein [Planctomycetota bacterium]
MAVLRCLQNPIIKPEDIKSSRDDFEVVGVFNPGVVRFGNEVILFLRVAERPICKLHELELTAVYDMGTRKIVVKEFSKDDPRVDFSDPRLIITPAQTYLTSLSHFRVARSKDGVNFQIDDTPTMETANEFETFGIEDPRIAFIDGVYYITYVSVSPLGVTTSLALTRDFERFERCGVVSCPDNKDVVLFPKKIGGKYYLLQRPMTPLFKRYDMWISESADLRYWGNHRYLMGAQKAGWDGGKIGAGAVPFEVEQGWLEVYHGVDEKDRYCLGAVLLDKEKPWKVIARAKQPILVPEKDYECSGFFSKVVFTCGLLYEQEKLKIYYGAADSVICCAELALQEVLEQLEI